MKTTQSDIRPEEIAQRAYEIWQARGCPEGDGSHDWRAAEAELIAARGRRNGSPQHRLRNLFGRVRQKVSRQNS